MQRRSNPAKSAVISQRSHPTQTDNPSYMQPMHIRASLILKSKQNPSPLMNKLILISVSVFSQAT
jgi:hypothetical protein